MLNVLVFFFCLVMIECVEGSTTPTRESWEIVASRSVDDDEAKGKKQQLERKPSQWDRFL